MQAPSLALAAGTVRGAAPAKLNLALRIVGRRHDGYHLLDSTVVPVSLYDELAICVERSANGEVEVECLPGGLDLDPRSNLAARAATLFLDRSGCAAAVRIVLTKRIPVGAGLGGGSSDAAGVLRGLNLLLDRPLPAVELARWGLELGADVPFFLYGLPARMRGIGEQIEPVRVPTRAGAPIVIAFPGVPLDTRAVYRAYDDSLTSKEGLSSIRPPTLRQESPHELLINDLEAAAFQVRPVVRSLRQRLASLGARGVLMTGSGSAVFGLWRDWDDARAAVRYLRTGGTWAHVVQILESSPTFEVLE